MSVSVVSLVERGAKVEDKTLSLIEDALDFPEGTFSDFLAGRISSLPEQGEEPPPPRGQDAVDRILAMTREEIFREAELHDEIEPGAGDDYIRRVMEIRRKAWDQRRTSIHRP